MKYCIKCGQEIPSVADFCPSCGTKQVQDVRQQNTNIKSQDNHTSNYNMWQSIGDFYSINPKSKVMNRQSFWKATFFNFVISAIYLFIALLVSYWGNQEYYFNSAADLHNFQTLYMTIYWIVRCIGILGSITISIASIFAVVRRLHDTNHTGWLWFLSLVPIVNIALLILLTSPSETKNNRYI